jgi:heavy metal sensor kinase
MKTDSLRFRLTAGYAGLLTAAVVGLTALFFLHLKDYLENTLEETQLRRAHQIAETLVAKADRTGDAYVAQQVASLYAPEKGDRFIRLTERDGRVFYVSGPPNDQAFDPAAVPPAPPSVETEFSRRQPQPGNAGLLIGTVRIPAGSGSYLVEVGTSAAPVEALFRHLLFLLCLGFPVVIVLAAGGGYFLVGRALRPVEQITNKAEQITQHNLSERLPVARSGDELERLSTALNHMITRLDDAFQNSKRFVADASHELRTPLTVLRGELEVLAQEPALSADQRERLGSLLEEVERLTKIVERLFALSRLDAGEAQVEWVKFDLASLAASTAGQMALLAEDRRLTLECETDALVAVEGDRARLKQVVVNLLDNAIKYTPEGGTVRLRVCARADEAVLEVADSGIGIPPEAVGHVFDRFFRVDPSRSLGPDGAGLGLAIVKSICQAHGAKVEVESTPGQGSTFRLRLPLAAT